MFELIGCPMHFGVSDEGLKRSVDSLNQAYPNLAIKSIGEVEKEEQPLNNLKNLNSVAATCEAIAAETDRIIKSGRIPLFFGGDHSAAMGTVSGAAANGRGLGLLWIDAHSDINTDVTTLTGNIHGMPVSALMGYGNEILCGIFGDRMASPELSKVLPQHTVFYGLRDVDPLEEEIIERLNIRCYTYAEICRRGQEECLEEALEYLSECPKLHISFDLDSMNPKLIKGVTVPVADGFNRQEVLFQFAYLLEHAAISSIDIVEYNPVYDSDKKTAEFVNRLVKQIRK